MTDNPIFAVAAKAQELRDQGADVISLAAGEPQAATGAYRSILRVAPQARGRTSSWAECPGNTP
ncbi:hypothetical protein JK364_44610 [Streptomyces sp. 110]|uniref:Aspartate aminotransferase n=1 Tax=Streptomyces endocoffeicus TaxID=2898945 RepID=A0ABS1Q5H1_9ACTN|nr:hypothetical protein [Streptomyces endocoffeicus]MBL1119392.1 hypothetical protein [Streptomyces endocoffeicus]